MKRKTQGPEEAWKACLTHSGGWRAGRESSVKEARGIHDLKVGRSRWKEVWEDGRVVRAGGRARAKVQKRETTEGGEAVVTDGSGVGRTHSTQGRGGTEHVGLGSEGERQLVKYRSERIGVGTRARLRLLSALDPKSKSLRAALAVLVSTRPSKGASRSRGLGDYGALFLDTLSCRAATCITFLSLHLSVPLAVL